MTKFINLLSLAIICCVVFISCETNEIAAPSDEISVDALSKIADAGFNTENAFATTWQGQRGYVVEYDIFLTDESLHELIGISRTDNSRTKQYHTTNLVTGMPRIIKVGLDPSFNADARDAFLATIDMYNAENLEMTFAEATATVSGKGKKKKVTTDADIFISAFSERPRRGFITLGRAAGFPTADGDPAEGFGLNTYWINNYSPSVSELTGVMAHEVGHTIGFRHTDYTTRESCGSNVNEGEAGVGAIYIPGTPTKSDVTSLMQSCGPSRVFNGNDVTALNYLY